MDQRSPGALPLRDLATGIEVRRVALPRPPTMAQGYYYLRLPDPMTLDAWIGIRKSCSDGDRLSLFSWETTGMEFADISASREAHAGYDGGAGDSGPELRPASVEIVQCP